MRIPILPLKPKKTFLSKPYQSLFLFIYRLPPPRNPLHRSSPAFYLQLPPAASFFSGLLLQLHRSGMEQTVDSQPTKGTRVSWKNNNVVKAFLETCILEIALNGKEGGSLKSLSWKKVSETLKDVHNFIVDRKQMRNHFDYLKEKYGVKLKNKTGNVYDPSTNSFNLT